MQTSEETPFSTYALKYELKAVPGRFAVEELKGQKRPSDALLLCTFRFHGDRVDADFSSIDGRKTVSSKGGIPKAMDDFDMFKAWLTLGMRLLEGGLNPKLKRMIRVMFTEIEKDAPLGMESGPEANSCSMKVVSDDNKN